MDYFAYQPEEAGEGDQAEDEEEQAEDEEEQAAGEEKADSKLPCV